MANGEKPPEGSEGASKPQETALTLEVVGRGKPTAKEVEEVKDRLRKARTERIAQYRYAKGQSGNPGGKNSRVPPEIRELCRAYTVEAVAAMVHVLRHSKDERNRIEAAKWFADRGWGKAAQLVGVVTQDDKPITFTLQISEGGEDSEPGENGHDG